MWWIIGALVVTVCGVVGAMLVNTAKSILGMVLMGLACLTLTFGAVLHSDAVYKQALQDVEVRAQEREALEDTLRQRIEDISILAYAIWYEARGEGELGQRAVATVIYNRASGDPGVMSDIVQRRNWLGNAPKLNPDDGDWTDDVLTEDCWEIAEELVKGEFRPLGPWTHFYNPQLAAPSWGAGMRQQFRIGDHLFGVVDEP